MKFKEFKEAAVSPYDAAYAAASSKIVDQKYHETLVDMLKKMKAGGDESKEFRARYFGAATPEVKRILIANGIEV